MKSTRKFVARILVFFMFFSLVPSIPASYAVEPTDPQQNVLISGQVTYIGQEDLSQKDYVLVIEFYDELGRLRTTTSYYPNPQLPHWYSKLLSFEGEATIRAYLDYNSPTDRTNYEPVLDEGEPYAEGVTNMIFGSPIEGYNFYIDEMGGFVGKEQHGPVHNILLRANVDYTGSSALPQYFVIKIEHNGGSSGYSQWIDELPKSYEHFFGNIEEGPITITAFLDLDSDVDVDVAEPFATYQVNLTDDLVLDQLNINISDSQGTIELVTPSISTLYQFDGVELTRFSSPMYIKDITYYENSVDGWSYVESLQEGNLNVVIEAYDGNKSYILSDVATIQQGENIINFSSADLIDLNVVDNTIDTLNFIYFDTDESNGKVKGSNIESNILSIPNLSYSGYDVHTYDIFKDHFKIYEYTEPIKQNYIVGFDNVITT